MPRSPVDRLFRGARRRDVLGFAVTAVLAGCSEAVPAPRAIRWGRDVCEFCHMTFADRRFAAEVWDPAIGRPHVYDDFGCAVLAVYEAGLIERTDIPFWVSNDAAPDTWLDARAALYRGDAVTPMGYGHSAGHSAAHTLDFTSAAAAIRKKALCEHAG